MSEIVTIWKLTRRLFSTDPLALRSFEAVRTPKTVTIPREASDLFGYRTRLRPDEVRYTAAEEIATVRERLESSIATARRELDRLEADLVQVYRIAAEQGEE